jgi:hypothetical protein
MFGFAKSLIRVGVANFREFALITKLPGGIGVDGPPTEEPKS